jgi:hypothetical protein
MKKHCKTAYRNPFTTLFVKVLMICMGLLTTPLISSAVHVVNGAVSARHIGGNNYFVEAQVVRACDGIALILNSVQINFRCGTIGVGTAILPALNFTPAPIAFGGPYPPRVHAVNLEFRDIHNVCDSILNPSISPNGKCRGGNVGNTFEYARYGAIVQLPSCSELWLELSLPCCRGVHNLMGSDIFTRTMLNTMGHPINATSQWHLPNNIVVSGCVGQQGQYHPFLSDPEGDSLMFRLECIRDNTRNCISYVSGYSAQLPIGGIQLDSITGNLKYSSSVAGKFAVGLHVLEYDRCLKTLKSNFSYDVLIDITSCSNSVPKDTGMTTVRGAIYQHPYYRVCQGTVVELTDTFIDANFNDSLHLITQIKQDFPTAEISLQSLKSGGLNRSVLHFKWRAVNMGSTFKYLQIGISDDRCPVPGKFFKAYPFVVENTIATDSLYTICKGDTADIYAGFERGKVSWQSISGDPLVWTGTNRNIWADTTAKDTNLHIRVLVQQPTRIIGAATYRSCEKSLLSCSTSDTLWIFPAKTYRVLLPPDTSYCNSSHLLQLNGRIDSAHFKTSWKWESIETIQFPDSSHPLVDSRTQAIYQYQVTSLDGCSYTGDIRVNPRLPVKASLTDTPCRDVCPGTEITLSAKTASGICGMTASEPSRIRHYNAPVTGRLKSGTTINGQIQYWPTPFASQIASARQQFLYRKSYLRDRGVRGGNIGSLAFYVHNLQQGDSLVGLTLKLNCTDDSVSTIWRAGSVTVFGPKTYTIVEGWNTIPFDTFYSLPNDKHLLVEICHFDPFATGLSLKPPSFELDSVSYIGTLVYDASGSPVCNINNVGRISQLIPAIRLGIVRELDSLTSRFRWYHPTMTLLDTQKTVRFTPGVSGNYKLVVGNFGQICTDTLSIPLNLRLVSLSGGGNQQICVDDSVQVSAVLSPPIFTGGVTWSPASLFKYPNQASTTLFGKRQDTATITFSHPCCRLADRFAISLLPKPNPDFMPKGPFCASSASTTLSGVVSGGAFFGTGVNTSNSTFNPADTAIKPGLHQPHMVSVTHIVNNGCQNDTTLTVAVYHPFDTLLQTPSTFCHYDDSLRLQTRHSGGQWSGPGTSSSGFFDPQAAGTGQHTVRVDSTGFCGNSGSYHFVVHPHPSVNIKTTKTLCPKNNLVMLNAQNPGADYVWNNNHTLQTLSVYSPGKYWVRVTNSHGCSTTDTALVKQSEVCVGIAEEDGAFTVKIYPNPFKQLLRISSSDQDRSEIALSLHDIHGRELLRRTIPTGTDTYTLHTQPLSRGVYVLRLEIRGKIAMYRVVKE